MIPTAIRMDMAATNAIQGWNFSFLLMGASGFQRIQSFRASFCLSGFSLNVFEGYPAPWKLV